MIDQVNQSILSAKEANELTDKQIQKDNSDLFPIMEVIHKAISRKEYYCHYTGIMKDYTKEKLHKLGYKLEYFTGGGNQREPGYHKISWEQQLS